MYKEFFGLTTKPFELVPNPQFLYLSKSHKKALSYLKYGIEEKAGFILLSGEVGSGKTTLMRNIMRDLGEDTAVAMVFNTKATSNQILAMINEDFGLAVEGKDKVRLIRDLNDHLIALHSRKIRPVVIIDEAQNLSAATLEEVRLLSNIQADSFKLLQIILVGQPELKEIIAQPSLRQLRQRISINCHLEPLDREEVEEYVHHRLAMAGNRDAVSFQEGAFDIIYNYSQGVPRLINVFADFLLLAAYAEGVREMTVEMVEEVVGDVAWDTPEEVAVRADPADEGPAGRLTPVEDVLASLDSVQESTERLENRLFAHERILTQIMERQEGQFLVSEERMKKIFWQIQALKEIPPPKPETINFKTPRKGFFARLFS